MLSIAGGHDRNNHVPDRRPTAHLFQSDVVFGCTCKPPAWQTRQCCNGFTRMECRNTDACRAKQASDIGIIPNSPLEFQCWGHDHCCRHPAQPVIPSQTRNLRVPITDRAPWRIIVRGGQTRKGFAALEVRQTWWRKTRMMRDIRPSAWGKRSRMDSNGGAPSQSKTRTGAVKPPSCGVRQTTGSSRPGMVSLRRDWK